MSLNSGSVPADIATGKYIAFIDSDDRISVDFYRHLISIAEEKHADIAVSNFLCYPYNKKSYALLEIFPLQQKNFQYP